MEGVINLSHRTLSEDEVSLLMRGLKFCPTPPCPDPGQGREDLDKLHRNLRLKSHFEDPSLVQDEIEPGASQADTRNDPNLLSPWPFKHNKFKRPSSWRGPIGPTYLEAFIASNERDYNHRANYRPPLINNVTTKERLALRTLMRDRSIVIKPADKGSSIVIMDRKDYLLEGYKQLSDRTFYMRVKEDLTTKHVKEINDLIEDTYQNTEIDESVRDYLMEKNIKTARFYLLPKIHKKNSATAGPTGRGWHKFANRENFPVCGSFSQPLQQKNQILC